MVPGGFRRGPESGAHGNGQDAGDPEEALASPIPPSLLRPLPLRPVASPIILAECGGIGGFQPPDPSRPHLPKGIGIHP
jgi:hypothetical protein